MDTKGEYYFLGGGTAGGNAMRVLEQKIQPRYLLGILNSQLCKSHVARIASGFRGGFYAFSKASLESLPIRTLDLSKPAEKKQHEAMVALVDTMLDLHKRLAKFDKTSLEAQKLTAEIEKTDTQIDDLVYDLYGLTAEERRIVEDSQ